MLIHKVSGNYRTTGKLRGTLQVLILSFAVLGFLLTTGCGDGELEQAPAEEQLFIGPDQLPLYDRLGPQPDIAGYAKHGEAVEILDQRRNFVQVRTSSGLIGWTHRRNLLTIDRLRTLQDLGQYASTLPSQGVVTVYAALNVHMEPFRNSPSFDQLQEGERAEIVGHVVMPRRPFALEPPVTKHLRQLVPRYRLSFPVLLAGQRTNSTDWLGLYSELGRLLIEQAASQAGEPSVPRDDWALIRLADHRAGWVLFSRLVMAIPDEVAQYAEGNRITSYFSLGAVPGTDKHHWLWTTLSEGGQSYEFDSVRVFVWNKRRERYETAFLLRRLRGYYPVVVFRSSGQAGSNSSEVLFSIVVETQEGQFEKQVYVFNGFRVQRRQSEPLNVPVVDLAAPVAESPPQAHSEEPGLLQKLFPWL